MKHRVGMVVVAAGALLASACPGTGTCDDPEIIDVPFTSAGAQDAEVGGREVDGDFVFPHGATDIVSVSWFGGAGNTDGDDTYEETRVASAELEVDREAGRVTRRYVTEDGRQVEETWRIVAEESR